MKKLKILIVTQYFWPENFKINDLVFYLAEKGYQANVLTGIPNYPKGKYFKGYGIFKNKNQLKDNVLINRVIATPRGRSSRLLLLINYISFVISASIKILFLKNKYDLIFIYEPSPITVAIPAILLKKISKTPIILWVTDLWPESIIATIKLNKFFKKITNSTINPLVKWIYNNSDKILVTSKGFISSIQNKIKEKNKIEFFPQWAEDIFKPSINKKELPITIPNNSFKVMFAGNIGEAQDFPSILKAAKLLRKNNIHWIILGDGRKKSWVKNKIKEYNLENFFHMLGSFPLEEMPNYYASSDAMLFSLKNEYIFSITIPAKVQSYLACGKPILAMVNGEASNIIKNSNSGMVCNSGDYKSLANNILFLSQKTKKELAEMSDNSLKCYKNNFDREMLFTRLEKIFINTIKK